MLDSGVSLCKSHTVFICPHQNENEILMISIRVLLHPTHLPLLLLTLPESASFFLREKMNDFHSRQIPHFGMCHGPGMVREGGIRTTSMLARTRHVFPMQCRVLLATKHVV